MFFSIVFSIGPIYCYISLSPKYPYISPSPIYPYSVDGSNPAPLRNLTIWYLLGIVCLKWCEIASTRSMSTYCVCNVHSASFFNNSLPSLSDRQKEVPNWCGDLTEPYVQGQPLHYAQTWLLGCDLGVSQN